MKNFIILICCIHFMQGAYSQEFYLSCEKQLSFHKKLRLSFEPELSFLHNPTFVLERFSFTNSLRYKTSKNLRNEIGYRMQTKSGNQESIFFESNESLRLYADMSLQFSLNSQLRCTYRYRFQSLYSDSEFTLQSRNRIKISHERKHGVRPYFLLEMYTNMCMNEFHKGKFSLGLEHSNSKKYVFGEFFTIEIRLKNGSPRMYYKMGFSVTIK